MSVSFYSMLRVLTHFKETPCGYGTLLTALVAVSTLTGWVATSSSGRPASYHYQMGVSYLEEHNYTAALTDLSEAEKLEPNNAGAPI